MLLLQQGLMSRSAASPSCKAKGSSVGAIRSDGRSPPRPLSDDRRHVVSAGLYSALLRTFYANHLLVAYKIGK